MKRLMAALAAALVAAAPAYSQQYPTKPVRVIVPFAPGGGSDITARQFSQKLSEGLGQQFLVDNRGGAGGLIGMELTAKAPPDGYTIMMMTASFAATAALNKPAFDPINTIVPIVELWFGAMAPRGTPQPVIGSINAAINKSLESAEMKKNLEREGMAPTGGAPQRFGERIRKDYERWTKVVQAAQLKPE